jgi:putative ABC transport system permease protein
MMPARREVEVAAGSRMRAVDALRVGGDGLRTRRMRSALSALGIAVAIGAIVAVLGLASSAQAQLLAQLGRESNLLTVAAGQDFGGTALPLPSTAESMVAAIPPVQNVTAVASLTGVTVRRSAAVPAIDTGGITAMAAEDSLPRTVGASVIAGRFLDAVAQRYPLVVLGFQAAKNLGIGTLTPQTQVYLGGRYFTVIGLLAPVSVAPELDEAALVSFPIATADLGLQQGASRLYLRTDPDQVEAVAAVLPFTASPAHPEAVAVRRPSDILAARAAAKTSFVGLYLALGAVSLLVGGVGIANTMVIAVLERRGEIGLRRAVGARSIHIGAQFLLEAAVLAAIGGIGGAGLGALATAVVDRLAHNPLTIPPIVPLVGFGAAIVVGVLAGIYPALRAARLTPAAALRSGAE